MIGVPDQRWGETVTAVLVAADPGHPPEIDVLRMFLRSQLAGFKIPIRWVLTSELPRNVSGKLLRRSITLADLKG